MIIHGEVTLRRINSLPKEISVVKTHGKFHIIAESEVSGNHHVIDIKDGIEFYEDEGTLYMKNDVETSVRCVVKERHDNIVLSPGIWEIDKQQGYDYFTESHINIAD